MDDEIKVSELPQASQVNAEDLLMIIQGGANKKAAANLLLDLTHPVGSIYMSSQSTNPSELFGGTWEQIKDKFILAAGDTYSAGATGGEATHKLTINEMPAHNHDIGYYTWKVSTSYTTGKYYINQASDNRGNTNMRGEDNEASYTTNTGGGAAHNNMPPYEVYYCWKRTA